MEKLTILCTAVTEMGHMNATAGVAMALKKRGHRVVFATEKAWEERLLAFGLEVALYEEKEKAEDEKAGKEWSEHMAQFEQQMGATKPEDKLKMFPSVIAKMLETAPLFNAQMEAIINKVKPNVVIEDYGLPLPAFIDANIPVVRLFSVGPLVVFNDPRLPPFGCGLPLTDQSNWQRCRQKIENTAGKAFDLSYEWFEKQCPQHPKLVRGKAYKSTNLNIFMYPKPLVEDFLKIVPADETHFGVDHCVREPFGEFEVPEKFKSLPGKLIFFSLGSMGNSFVGVMKRLISILSKSKNKFIVSMGYRSDQYELAANMWGEQVVPQLAVLPHVDLVLTHGGNNTFTETLYFGKPMIVLPLFGDQYDNAQRVVDVNIGRRFDPFTVTERELIETIDSLLLDETVAENVRKISKQIRESDSMERAVERVEFVAKHPKFPTFA